MHRLIRRVQVTGAAMLLLGVALAAPAGAQRRGNSRQMEEPALQPSDLREYSRDQSREVQESLAKLRYQSPAEQRQTTVERQDALVNQRGSFVFEKTPLQQVVEHLRDHFALNIVLAEKSSDGTALPLNTPITVQLDDVSVRAFLQIILRRVNLSYTIRDGVILIGDPGDIEREVELRLYPVEDLRRPRSFAFMKKELAIQQSPDYRWYGCGANFDGLIDVITTSIHPHSWDEVGGPGSIEILDSDSVLVVSQCHRTHTKIAALLAALRRSRALQGLAPAVRDDDGGATSPAASSRFSARTNSLEAAIPAAISTRDESQQAAEARLEAALAQHGNFSFQGTPLDQMLQSLREKYGLNIVVAENKLEEAAIALDAPLITSPLNDVSLAAFLRVSLEQWRLTYTIRDEAIVVSTEVDLHEPEEVRVYPVLDLVTPLSRTTRPLDFESLIDVITATIQPQAWDEVGGPGLIERFTESGALVIRQSSQVHAEIEAFLTNLRAIKAHQQPITAIRPASALAKKRAVSSRFVPR